MKILGAEVGLQHVEADHQVHKYTPRDDIRPPPVPVEAQDATQNETPKPKQSKTRRP